MDPIQFSAHLASLLATIGVLYLGRNWILGADSTRRYEPPSLTAFGPYTIAALRTASVGGGAYGIFQLAVFSLLEQGWIRLDKDEDGPLLVRGNSDPTGLTPFEQVVCEAVARHDYQPYELAMMLEQTGAFEAPVARAYAELRPWHLIRDEAETARACARVRPTRYVVIGLMALLFVLPFLGLLPEPADPSPGFAEVGVAVLGVLGFLSILVQLLYVVVGPLILKELAGEQSWLGAKYIEQLEKRHHDLKTNFADDALARLTPEQSVMAVAVFGNPLIDDALRYRPLRHLLMDGPSWRNGKGIHAELSAQGIKFNRKVTPLEFGVDRATLARLVRAELSSYGSNAGSSSRGVIYYYVSCELNDGGTRSIGREGKFIQEEEGIFLKRKILEAARSRFTISSASTSG